METIHNGKLVELVIRKSNYSISEIARLMMLNRRSLYNWFSKPNLNSSKILRVGYILRHDFSKEFPHLFSSEDFEIDGKLEKDGYWKNKYIKLLEEHNKLLKELSKK